jgi:hypothetical protein
MMSIHIHPDEYTQEGSYPPEWALPTQDSSVEANSALHG